MIPRFRRQKPPTVTVAGETFSPEPLDLQQTLELALVMAPYIALIENHWTEFKQALKDTTGARPRLLSAMARGMADQIYPEDLTKMFVILLGRPVETLAQAKPAELVAAIPILDDVNNFYDLFAAIRGLGFTAKYMPGDMTDA